MSETLYPTATKALAEKRQQPRPRDRHGLPPVQPGGLPRWGTAQEDEAAHRRGGRPVTQCPYCIRGHTKAATREGATPQEIMEAIWVAAEMRAGGAFAHSAIALDTLKSTAAPSD